jgi:hypothetical protein
MPYNKFTHKNFDDAVAKLHIIHKLKLKTKNRIFRLKKSALKGPMQSPETDLELEIDRLYQPIQSDDRISVKRSELDLSPSPKGCTGDG